MFYPKHIREILTIPSSASLPSPALEQVPSFQDLLVDIGNSYRGKDPGSYVEPWALSEDINLSEDKEVDDERPPDQTP